jgi:hypothetical protein
MRWLRTGRNQMAEDLIRYDILAQDALRGVIRKVLSEVARTGLPGEHHFFITLATHAPGVRISSRLLALYPEDLTIVLQHQYWDLAVTEQAFEVGLSFNGVPERLLVPFSAIKDFLDPSVQFQLRFEVVQRPTAVVDPQSSEPSEIAPPEGVAAAQAEAAPAADAGEPDKGEAEAAPMAEVVSLDAFRKK